MGFKYILFDLDGTLTNPVSGIYKSLNYALGILNEPPIPIDETAKFIGPPLLDGYMQNLGFDKEKALRAVALYRERYNSVGLYENELIDGAEELLRNLRKKGKMIAIATSKPEDLAVKIIERFGLSGYFDFIGGAEWDTGGRNNKTDIIRYALNGLGATPDDYKNCVIIGDRHHDIDGARAVGISAVAVLEGFGTAEELENADFIADKLIDAEKFV